MVDVLAKGVGGEISIVIFFKRCKGDGLLAKRVGWLGISIWKDAQILKLF